MSQIIVNAIDGARLRELTGFYKMLDDTYLTDLKNKQTTFIYDKFFRHKSVAEKEHRLSVLNISYSIPTLISEKLSDYVGDPTTPIENLELEPYISTYSWGGMGIFKVRNVEGELKLEPARPDGYVRDSETQERLLTYITHIDDKTGAYTYYVFEQTYTPGTILNKLYKLDSITYVDGTIRGTPVALDTIEATANIPESESTGLDRNPLVIVRNRTTGVSDIKKIRSLISSIEIQLVNIQDQFLKHLQAKLAVPVSKLPRDKKTGIVDVSNLEIIGMENGDTLPAYIINTNPLIEKAFGLIENMIIQIASILSLPIEFFGLKNVGGAESGDAKRIRISSWIKRVDKTRKKFENGLNQVAEVAEGLGVNEWNDDFFVVWDEIFPIDKKQEVDELSVARKAGFISQKKAVMKYLEISEEDAIAEIEEINNENPNQNEPDPNPAD